MRHSVILNFTICYTYLLSDIVSNYIFQISVSLHLFSFKTPILQSKKIRKKCKINSRNFTYNGLTFFSSFWIFEEVKDEIWKHKGCSWISIQYCVNFIMFIHEFASLVLNTVFLFLQLTQLEHINR
jgi:hypothetical protein